MEVLMEKNVTKKQILAYLREKGYKTEFVDELGWICFGCDDSMPYQNKIFMDQVKEGRINVYHNIDLTSEVIDVTINVGLPINLSNDFKSLFDQVMLALQGIEEDIIKVSVRWPSLTMKKNVTKEEILAYLGERGYKTEFVDEIDMLHFGYDDVTSYSIIMDEVNEGIIDVCRSIEITPDHGVWIGVTLSVGLPINLPNDFKDLFDQVMLALQGIEEDITKVSVRWPSLTK
jgi:DNA-dependent RNA polymerase auxiliary subunit epsilon